jgi:hypothetical protein
MVVQMLTTHRIAVLVSKHDAVINLDSALWSDSVVNPHHAHYALVPVKQSLRLVIHDYLLDCGKLTGGSAEKEEDTVKQIAQVPSDVSAVPVFGDIETPVEAVVVPSVVTVTAAAPVIAEQVSTSSSSSSSINSASTVDSFVLEGREGVMDRTRLKKMAASGEVCMLILW